jgi:hypothetical protein
MPGRSFAAPARLALLLVLHGAAAAAAEPAGVDWDLSGGVRHRTLTERASTGARLVTETGAMAQLRLSAEIAASGRPALALAGAVTAGSLDYEGQTQGGQALSVASRHREGELSIDGRALDLFAGEVWAGVKWLHATREIGTSATTGALGETSSLLLPGLQWRSPALSWPALGRGTSVRLQAGWRASVRHRLAVDYHGAYDRSVLRAARRQEAALRVSAATRGAWRWDLEWTHARQSASGAAALYRGGAPAGVVIQPSMRIDDVSISVTRVF